MSDQISIESNGVGLGSSWRTVAVVEALVALAVIGWDVSAIAGLPPSRPIPFSAFEAAALAGAAALLATSATFVERALAVVLFAFGPQVVVAMSHGAAPAFCTGLAAQETLAVVFLATVAAARQAARPDRKGLRLLVLALAIGVAPIASDIHLLAIRAPGFTYDAAIFNFDQKLGVRVPSLATVLARPVQDLVVFAYLFTPGFVAGADAFGGLRPDRLSLTTAFILSAALGAICYAIVPVAGIYFPDADYLQRIFATDSLLPVGSTELAGIAPRNCMPSLHTTWGLFLFWRGLRCRSRLLRWGLGLAGVLQIVGALMCGHHWFLDVVVAVPFAFALDAVFAGRRADFAAATICAGVVALWFLALRSFRFADLSSTTAWLLVAATLGAPWLARRLVDWSRRGSPTWPSLRQAIDDELRFWRRVARAERERMLSVGRNFWYDLSCDGQKAVVRSRAPMNASAASLSPTRRPLLTDYQGIGRASESAAVSSSTLDKT